MRTDIPSTGRAPRERAAVVEGETEQPRAVVPRARIAGQPGRRFRTFDSLIEVPAFRWYLLSMTGNWSAMQMQQVVRGILAYQLTGSFAALGGVELASSLPRVLFAVSGGIVADRAARRYVLQAGQVFNGLLAGVLAGLTFAGMLRFEHLIIAAMLQGVSNSFTLPARQAMIPEIVGRERITNAYGLNVFSMNVMRLMAPALAGVLIAVTGAGWVFVVMALLYVAAVVTMFRVPAIDGRARAAAAATTNGTHEAASGGARPAPGGRRGGRRGGQSVADVRDAFVYLRGQRALVLLLLVNMFLSILSLPYQRLLPGFVSEVLSANEDQAAVRVGLLLTVTAVGALAGSLTIASLPNRGRGKLLIASIALFGVALLAFAASSLFWVSAAIVLVLGVGQSGRQSLQNILIQSNVSDEYRGRVSSVMLLEDGIESLGIFGVAILAATFGVQVALGAVALGMIALALTLWFLSPTYRDLD